MPRQDQPDISTTDARCPRCGYDQRGVLARWIEACDLETTCTECGLRIDWAEVLSPERQQPRWSIEFASSPWSFLIRTVRSVIAAHWPWFMLRSLRMTDRIGWRRVIAFALMMLLLMGAAQYVAARVHIALNVHWSFTQKTGVRFQATSTATAFEICLRSIFTPRSRLEFGTLNFQGQTAGYPPPIFWSRFAGWHWPNIQKSAMWYWAFACCVLAFAPIAFLALPISRRKGKVRWAHIFRIGCYSIGLLTAPALLISAGIILLLFNSAIAVFLFQLSNALCVVGLPLVALLYWHAAVKRYLLMTQPIPVSLSVVFLACLAAACVTFYLRNPMSIVEFFEWARRAFG